MKTLLFCMLGLGLTACGSSPKGTNGDQDELAMLIGTYTNGSSKGIYTFRFNQETGTAVPLSSAALPNPSYLVPSGDGEFVYAVSEMNDSTAALSSLSLDRETGELRLLNTVPTFGADPCYVATNGREVLTANYSGEPCPSFLYRKTVLWLLQTRSFKALPPVPTPYGKPLPTSIARSFHRTESISSPPTSVPTASCAL